jgi:hypothetical protein
MVPEFIPQWLSKEALKHPAFFLTCIVLFGVVTGSVWNPFVMADDFTNFQRAANTRLGKLEFGVCTVQFTTERNGLESQARAVSTEIFQLERLVAAQEATPRDLERMDDLRTDLAHLERELQILVQGDRCIDPGATP